MEVNIESYTVIHNRVLSNSICTRLLWGKMDRF